jgi:hypothetical protein
MAGICREGRLGAPDDPAAVGQDPGQLPERPAVRPVVVPVGLDLAGRPLDVDQGNGQQLGRLGRVTASRAGRAVPVEFQVLAPRLATMAGKPT